MAATPNNENLLAPATRRTEQRLTEQRQPEPPRDTRVRRRARDAAANPFHIDSGEVPEGYSWEWKRMSTAGQDDQEHQISLQEDGWLPVLWCDRIETKRPPGITSVMLRDPVRRKGMMLMQRPVELTREAQIEDAQAASDQVMDKMRALGQAPPETFTREHRNLDNHIKREYAPAGIPVPKE